MYHLMIASDKYMQLPHAFDICNANKIVQKITPSFLRSLGNYSDLLINCDCFPVLINR